MSRLQMELPGTNWMSLTGEYAGESAAIFDSVTKKYIGKMYVNYKLIQKIRVARNLSFSVGWFNQHARETHPLMINQH